MLDSPYRVEKIIPEKRAKHPKMKANVIMNVITAFRQAANSLYLE